MLVDINYYFELSSTYLGYKIILCVSIFLFNVFISDSDLRLNLKYGDPYIIRFKFNENPFNYKIQ